MVFYKKHIFLFSVLHPFYRTLTVSRRFEAATTITKKKIKTPRKMLSQSSDSGIAKTIRNKIKRELSLTLIKETTKKQSNPRKLRNEK